MSLNAVKPHHDQGAAFVVIRYYWRRTQGHAIHRAAVYDSAGQQVWNSGKDGRYGGSGTASHQVKQDLAAAGVDHAGAALVEYWARTMKELKAPFVQDVVTAGRRSRLSVPSVQVVAAS